MKRKQNGAPAAAADDISGASTTSGCDEPCANARIAEEFVFVDEVEDQCTTVLQ